MYVISLHIRNISRTVNVMIKAFLKIVDFMDIVIIFVFVVFTFSVARVFSVETSVTDALLVADDTFIVVLVDG